MICLSDPHFPLIADTSLSGLPGTDRRPDPFRSVRDGAVAGKGEERMWCHDGGGLKHPSWAEDLQLEILDALIVLVIRRAEYEPVFHCCSGDQDIRHTHV